LHSGQIRVSERRMGSRNFHMTFDTKMTETTSEAVQSKFQGINLYWSIYLDSRDTFRLKRGNIVTNEPCNHVFFQACPK